MVLSISIVQFTKWKKKNEERTEYMFRKSRGLCIMILASIMVINLSACALPGTKTAVGKQRGGRVESTEESKNVVYVDGKTYPSNYQLDSQILNNIDPKYEVPISLSGKEIEELVQKAKKKGLYIALCGSDGKKAEYIAYKNHHYLYGEIPVHYLPDGTQVPNCNGFFGMSKSLDCVLTEYFLAKKTQVNNQSQH